MPITDGLSKTRCALAVVYLVPFRIAWWWLMVLFQLFIESYATTPLNSLFFEFNVIYGAIVLINFLIRRKYWIADEKTLKFFRLSIHLELHLVTDSLLVLFSAYYNWLFLQQL